MKKKILEDFIDRYSVGGFVNKVTWHSDGSKVEVLSSSDDKSLVADVSFTDLSLANGEYDIFDTTQLRSLLSVLGEDVDIFISQANDGSPIAFKIVDNDTAAIRFVLSDHSVIPTPPKVGKDLPKWELVFNIDQKFVTAFSKAAGALRDEETFTVVSDGQEARVEIGYSEINNQNNVKLKVNTVQNNILAPIHFSVMYMREILHANRDVAGTMAVSPNGVARLSFKADGFVARYIIFKVNQ